VERCRKAFLHSCVRDVAPLPDPELNMRDWLCSAMGSAEACDAFFARAATMEAPTLISLLRTLRGGASLHLFLPL
jgi:hypothetical protein